MDYTAKADDPLDAVFVKWQEPTSRAEYMAAILNRLSDNEKHALGELIKERDARVRAQALDDMAAYLENEYNGYVGLDVPNAIRNLKA